MRIFLLYLFALLGPAAQAGTNGIFDVRAFGATGDGKTKDTAAFQKALDACAAAANGGIVTVTSGVYLVGSIVIGSNTTLQLDGRASLLGSPDIGDYPLVRVRWEGEYVAGALRAHFRPESRPHRHQGARFHLRAADHREPTAQSAWPGPHRIVRVQQRHAGGIHDAIPADLVESIPSCARNSSPAISPSAPSVSTATDRHGFLPGRAHRPLQHRYGR